MSLINCPECNKEISGKAKCCPNCGYELPKQEQIYQGIYCPKCLHSIFKIDENEKCPICHIQMVNSIRGTREEIYNYTDNHPELKESPDFDEQAYQKRINWAPVVVYSSSKNNTVKCPYCNSTNTKKISTMSKAGLVALFGIFALGKTTKQWHCNQCGSDF